MLFMAFMVHFVWGFFTMKAMKSVKCGRRPEEEGRGQGVIDASLRPSAERIMGQTRLLVTIPNRAAHSVSGVRDRSR